MVSILSDATVGYRRRFALVSYTRSHTPPPQIASRCMTHTAIHFKVSGYMKFKKNTFSCLSLDEINDIAATTNATVWRRLNVEVCAKYFSILYLLVLQYILDLIMIYLEITIFKLDDEYVRKCLCVHGWFSCVGYVNYIIRTICKFVSEIFFF